MGCDQLKQITEQGSTSTTSNSAATSATPAASTSPAAKAKPAKSKPPLTVQKLKNTQYYVLADGPTQLKDGKAEDQKKRSFQLGEVVAYGDLNKDGTKDAIAPLTITIDGRNFVYLVGVLNDAGQPKNVSAQFLGEGLEVKSLSANAGEVVAKMEKPGVSITRTYQFKNFKQASAAKPTPAQSPTPSPSPQAPAKP